MQAGWVQYAESNERERHDQALGSWRSAAVSKHVGAVLQRSIGDCVSPDI